MLNRTSIKLGSNSQTVTFNTPCTGMLQKSHSKSKMVRFAKGSPMEGFVFSNTEETPYIYQYKWDDKGYENYKETKGKVTVEVLQVVIFGDVQYLVEVVECKDLYL